MGIPLRQGRQLSSNLDGPENKGPTVLVNEAFVSKFIPHGLDPTTQRMDDSAKEEGWTRIVGVAGNVRQSIYEPPMAESDWLMDEIPTQYKADLMSTMFLVVRTDGDPAQITSAVRSAVHDLDPTIPFDEPRTMNEVLAEALVFERMESWLFGIFAALALAWQWWDSTGWSIMKWSRQHATLACAWPLAQPATAFSAWCCAACLDAGGRNSSRLSPHTRPAKSH